MASSDEKTVFSSVKGCFVYDTMNSKCRPTMEDAHRVVDAYDGKKDQAFFGVYDGHGGRGVVDFVAKHLDEVLRKEIHFDKSRSVKDCLASAYIITDIQSRKAGLMSSGCTAVTCFLESKKGRKILNIANVGDARAVLCKAGRAVRLTYDHKATDAAEQKRIQDAGGFVLRGRVLGILAVSRSFGDHGLKQFVSARPFTTETEITPDCQFLALCCDGVYDVMKDEDVVKFVLEHSKGGQPNPKIAQMLVKEALLRKTTDNVTAMVIYF